MPNTVQINCEILRWARETAHLTREDAAHKLAISPQRIDALESGTEFPTRALLLKVAKLYRRPLLAFYLQEPPPKGARGEDFRRLPAEVSASQEALVDALVRDIMARQDIVRSTLVEEDEGVEIPTIGSMRAEDGLEAVSRSIQEYINFDLGVFRRYKTISDAFSYLRGKVESVGFFVLLIGDLGSHHSALSVEHFRGFALADKVAPFIVINDKDAKSAWAFTLLHELAHLWIGREGISGAQFENGVEQFCNDVAAHLLLQNSAINDLTIPAHGGLGEAVEIISAFADELNVSRSMVAYQLYRRGQLGYSQWMSIQAELRRLWMEVRERERQSARTRESGPTYYVVRRYHVGRALVEFVSRMTKSGVLTSTKAGKVLGVKPRNVYELIS